MTGRDPHTDWFPLDRHDPRIQALIAELTNFADQWDQHVDTGQQAAENHANGEDTND